MKKPNRGHNGGPGMPPTTRVKTVPETGAKIVTETRFCGHCMHGLTSTHSILEIAGKLLGAFCSPVCARRYASAHKIKLLS